MKLDLTKLKDNLKLIVICIPIVILLIFVDNKKINTSLARNMNKDLSKGSLVINEVMTSNKGVYVDNDGKAYDWVELYNGTDNDINLKNYGLSDTSEEKVKWLFPNVTIKSKGYLIINLSEIEQDGLYASFKLKKSGGEKLTLRASSGEIIDSVKTLNIPKNNSMMRDENGEWIITDEITPGYENSEEGRKKFIESLNGDDDSLIITEVLPNNKGNYIVDNKLPSYIEVTNNSEDTINLKDYYISNDIRKPFLCRLPDKELKPNEVYLMYADGIDEDEHVSFELEKKNGTLYLSKKGKIINKLEYNDLNNGTALIYDDDNYIESSDISPGYLNDMDGKEKYQKSLKLPKELIINEVMTYNTKYLSQNGGKYYDWVELYNNTGKIINLRDYSLTKDKGDYSYKLPDINLNKNEYIVLMASGNESLSNSDYKHIDFKLSNYEGLYLYHDNKLIDSMYIYNIPKNYSYGRGKQGGYYYYKESTPNKINDKNGVIEVSYAPIFSKEAGAYNNVDNLEIELKGNGKIYYTLDGSDPNKNSTLYTKPIKIDKTSTIKAINYVDKAVPSEVVTNSYIINENHTLPVLSITIKENSFNKLNYSPNSDITEVAHAQLLDGDNSFSIDCGMKVFGGESRSLPKKSYALKFKKEYGGVLKSKVFQNRDAYEYKTLVLRSGSQDMTGSMFKDELVSSIIDDYGTIDVQANKPIILYVNNKYHGIYYIREKIDEDFITNHYNVNNDKTNIIRIDYDVTTGSSKPLTDLVQYTNTHNMKDDKVYEEVTKKLDIDNYIDLWIAQLYSNDYDIRNVRFFNNPDIDGGRIKTIGYDFDFAFEQYPDNYFIWMTDPSGMGYFKINNSLLINLFKNDKFKTRFIERLGFSLKNIYTYEHVTNNYKKYYNVIEKEIKRDHERWNISYDSWTLKCIYISTFLNDRNILIKNQAKQFFGLSDKDMKKYFE